MRNSTESSSASTGDHPNGGDPFGPPGAAAGHDGRIGRDRGVAEAADLGAAPGGRLSPEEAERAAVDVAQATDVPLVTPARRTWQSILGMVLGLIALGALSAAFLFYPIDWQVVGRWGYAGIAAVVFVATASVALPIPYLLIVARAGTHLDPILIGVVAGLAGMLGEVIGYVIGLSGSRIIPHGRWYDRAQRWICTYGFWCIALFACVPNPFFDAIGIAAGTLRYSWWRFALSCFIGKAIKFLIAALIGVEAIRHGWLR